MNEKLIRICDDARAALKKVKNFHLRRWTFGRTYYQDATGNQMCVGCALTAIYVADNGPDCLSDRLDNQGSVCQHIKTKYAIADDVRMFFTSGFDAEHMHHKAIPEHIEYKEAYMAGHNLAKELL